MPGVTAGRLQIGDVAESTGLSLRTIRHYEEIGLLPAPERSPGGFRLYTQAVVDRLLVIKQMKPLGFTLEQMTDLLDALDGTSPAEDPCRLDRRIQEYAELVAARANELRSTLEQAEEFHRTLTERVAAAASR